jgi:hypothetical protein
MPRKIRTLAPKNFSQSKLRTEDEAEPCNT